MAPAYAAAEQQYQREIEQQHWSAEAGWQNRRADIQADREEDYNQRLQQQSAAAQQKEIRDTQNSVADEAAQETGQKFYVGQDGIKRPVLDPQTNKPVYAPRTSQEQTDDNGIPFKQVTDSTGQTRKQIQYKDWDGQDPDAAQAAAIQAVKQPGINPDKLEAAKYLQSKEAADLSDRLADMQDQLKSAPKPLAPALRKTLMLQSVALAKPADAPQPTSSIFGGSIAVPQADQDAYNQAEADRLSNLQKVQQQLADDDSRTQIYQQYNDTRAKLKESKDRGVGGYIQRFNAGRLFTSDDADEKKNDIADSLSQGQSDQASRDQQRQTLQAQIQGGLKGPDLDQANAQLATLNQADQAAKPQMDAAKQQLAIANAAPTATPSVNVAPDDGAPAGQTLDHYQSLISGRSIDPTSVTGKIIDFARRMDNDLDTAALGAIGGAARLTGAFAQSSLNPQQWIDHGTDALFGTHTQATLNAGAQQLGVAADIIDKASKKPAFSVASKNDDSLEAKVVPVASGILQAMLGGEGKVAQGLQAGGYALSVGEEARQRALDSGATPEAANQAGFTAGLEMAAANYIFGPFSKLLAKVPGISSASPSVAKLALNTVMGLGVKAAKGAAEFGLQSAGSEAANQIALEQSNQTNQDGQTPGQKILSATLSGMGQGALMGTFLEGIERGTVEYNNLKVGQAVKAAGAKAAIVQQTADAFQQINEAAAAGKLTPQQAHEARAAVLSPFTPENQAQVAVHADNVNRARDQGTQIVVAARKADVALGTPDPDYKDLQDDQVYAAANATPDDAKLTADADMRWKRQQIKNVTAQRLEEVSDDLKASTAATQTIAAKPGGASTLASLFEHNSGLPAGQKLDPRTVLPVHELQSLTDSTLNDPDKAAGALSAQGYPVQTSDIVKAQQLAGHSQNMPEHMDVTEQQHAIAPEIEGHQKFGNKTGEFQARQKVVALESKRRQGVLNRLVQNVRASREVDALKAHATAIKQRLDAVEGQPDELVKPIRQAYEKAKEKADRVNGLAKIANGQHESQLTAAEREALKKAKATDEQEDGTHIITNEGRQDLQKDAPQTAKLIQEPDEVTAKNKANARANVRAEQESRQQSKKDAGKNPGKEPEGGSWTARGEDGTEVSIPASKAGSQSEAEPLLAAKLPKGELLDRGSVEDKREKVEKPADRKEAAPYSGDNGKSQPGNEGGGHRASDSKGDGSAKRTDGSTHAPTDDNTSNPTGGTGGPDSSATGDRAATESSGTADVSGGKDVPASDRRGGLPGAKALGSGAIDSEISRVQARLGALNAARRLTGDRAVSVVEDSGDHTLAASIDDEGKITIHVNRARTTARANRDRFMRHGGDANRWLTDAMNEEVVHVADLMAARDAWEASDKSMTAPEFWKAERRKNLAVARMVIKSGNKVVARAFIDSFHNYENSGKPMNDDEFAAMLGDVSDEGIEKTALALMDHLEGKPEGQDVMHMSEFIRQLIQAKNEGTLTEVGYHNIVGRLLNWMRQVYENLQQAAYESPELAHILKPIEETLALADGKAALPTGERAPPMSDEEIAAQDAARKDALKEAFDERPTLIQMVKKLGGIATTDAELQGELQNIKEAGNKGHMMQLFRKDGMKLDALREALGERGFNFDTITAMLDAIHDSQRSGKPVYGAGESKLGAGGEKSGLPDDTKGVESGHEPEHSTGPGDNSSGQSDEEAARSGSPKAAAEILRRSEEASRGPSGGGSGFLSSNKLLAANRARAIREFDYKDLADRLGKLRDDDGIPEGTRKLGQGVEHQVFYKDGDTRVTKLTKPNEYGLNIVGKETATPHSYLERLALQNEAFGDDIKWEGISGDNRTITSQPFYHPAKDSDGKDIPASPEGIKSRMETDGFVSMGHGEWYNPKNKIIAGDAFPRNFIKLENGIVHPIDLQLRKANATEQQRYEENPEVRAAIVKPTILHAGGGDEGQLDLDLGMHPKQEELDFSDKDKKPGELVMENRGLAQSIAAKYKVPGVDSDDIRQEANVALFKAARSYDASQGAKFSTWAHRLISNRLNDLYGKAMTVAKHNGGTLDEPVSEDGLTREEVTPDTKVDKTLPMEKSETSRIMDEEIRKLPKRPQQIVQAFREGKNGQQIADELGITKQAVSNSLRGALAIMRQRLKSRGLKGHEGGILHAGGNSDPDDSPDFSETSFADSKDAFDEDEPSTWPISAERIEHYEELKKGEPEDHDADFATKADELAENGWPEDIVAKARELHDLIAQHLSDNEDSVKAQGKAWAKWFKNPDREIAYTPPDPEDPETWPPKAGKAWDKLDPNEPKTWPAGLEQAADAEGMVDREDPETPEIDTDFASAWMAEHVAEPEWLQHVNKLPEAANILKQRSVDERNREVSDETDRRMAESPELAAVRSTGDTAREMAKIYGGYYLVPGYGADAGKVFAEPGHKEIHEADAPRARAAMDESAKAGETYYKAAERVKEQVAKEMAGKPMRDFSKPGNPDRPQQGTLFAGGEDEDYRAELMRQIQSDMPTQAEIAAHRANALGEEPGKQTIGVPSKANYAGDRETRRGIDTIQDLADSRREAETQQQWIDQARERVQRDPDAVKSDLLQKAFNPEAYGTFSPVDVKAAQLLVPRLMREAYASGDRTKIKEATTLAWAYDAGGSDQARAFAARRDPFKTPAERHIEFLTKLIASPGAADRARLKGITDPKEKQDALEKAQNDRLEKITKALGDMGVRLEDVFAGEARVSLKTSQLARGAVEGMGDAKKQKAARMIMDGYSDRQIAKQLGISPRDAADLSAKFDANLQAKLLDYARRGFTAKDLDNEDLTKLFAGDPEVRKVDLTPEQEKAIVAEMMRKFRPDQGERNSGQLQKRLKRRVDKPAPYQGKGPSDAPIPGYEPMKQDEMKPGMTAEEQAEFNRTRKPSDAPADATRYRQQTLDYDKELPYEHVRFDPNSKEQVFKLARAIQASDGNKFDMVYEAWVNSILSGPQTHVALSMGMAANAAWDFTAQRGMEALTNAAFFHDPNAAQFGEFKHMLRAVFPSIGRALKFGAKVFNSEEHYAFEHSVLNQQLEFKGASDNSGGQLPAIPGKLGRIIRIPARMVMFQDSFFKQVIGQMECSAQAYRLGKAQGLKGQDLENYIHGQVNLPGSDAWQRAVAKAEEGTFQTALRSHAEGGGPAEGIARKIQDMRHGDASTWQGQIGEKMLGLVFPFIRTPYNIFRTGLSKTPLGSVAVAGRIANGLFSMKDGKPFIDSYSKAQMVKDLATQTIAWGTAAALWSMVEGDKDDDSKSILLTGSRPHGVAKEGERDLANRVAGGPYQIRIGGRNGTYINYGRIEPFATVLGTVADAIRIAKQGQGLAASLDKFGGYFLSQAQDKTFLQGISSIASAVQDPQGITKGLERSFLQGLVPNLIRQPLRNLDDYERDSRGAGAGYDATALGGLAQKKIDLYGNPVMKQGNPLSRIVARSGDIPEATYQKGDQFLTNWNRLNPDQPYFPARETNYTYKDLTGKKVQMTPAQIEEFDRRSGHAFAQSIPEWLNAQMIRSPKEDDVKMFRNQLEKARSQTREEMFGDGMARQPAKQGADMSSIFGWR